MERMEKEHTHTEGTERKGEIITGRLHTISAEPDVGLKFTNPEIIT